MAVAAVYWWSVVEMLILTVSVSTSTTDGSVLVVSGREVDPNSVCFYYRWQSPQCTGGQW